MLKSRVRLKYQPAWKLFMHLKKKRSVLADVIPSRLTSEIDGGKIMHRLIRIIYSSISWTNLPPNVSILRVETRAIHEKQVCRYFLHYQ